MDDVSKKELISEICGVLWRYYGDGPANKHNRRVAKHLATFLYNDYFKLGDYNTWGGEE